MVANGHFICSMPELSMLVFFIIGHIALMGLVFYLKDILEKVSKQRTERTQRMRRKSKKYD